MSAPLYIPYFLPSLVRFGNAGQAWQCFQVLIERVKKQLDAKKFAEFRQCGGAFLRGEMDAAAYHKEVRPFLRHKSPGKSLAIEAFMHDVGPHSC